MPDSDGYDRTMFEPVNPVTTLVAGCALSMEGTTMTSTKAPVAKPAPKVANPSYRILVRILATKAGWKLSQPATNTDLFTKGDTQVALHYSKAQVVTKGEVVKGDKHSDLFTKGLDKFPQALTTLVGKPWTGTLISRFKDSDVAPVLSSGKGLALIKEVATKAPVASSAPKPSGKGKATSARGKAAVAAHKAASAPKPTGPTSAQRQAAKDQEHIEQM